MANFAQNKSAYRDYEIMEEFEAGVALAGPEVKSVRRGTVQMKGGYVSVLTDGPYVMGVHISPYKFASGEKLDPIRKRKLLLKAKEIKKLEAAEKTAGLAIVPLQFYPKQGLIKLKIAIGKGRKQHDKRNLVKERDLKREAGRALRNKY